MIHDEDSAQFWEDIYKADDAGWDLGGATPVFESLADEFKPGSLAIVGCGRGYDGIMFSKKGYNVWVFDFAPAAIGAVKKLARANQQNLKVVQKDIFTLQGEYQHKFDYVIEQTCFCAINPRRRKEYEKVVFSLLKPGGLLMGLWFPLDKKLQDGGPAWGTTIQEVKSLFKKNWSIVREEFSILSVTPRKNREKLIIFRKK